MLIYPEFNVYQFEIKPPYKNKIEIYNYFVDKHLYYIKTNPYYKKSEYNFLIDKFENYFDDIYDIFLNISRSIFGDITLSPRNSRKCWINVTARNDNTMMHNHLNTSTINSVFYFNMPDNMSGEIIFKKNNNIIHHQPKENTLIIFPNNLDHMPLMCDSDQYRMAVNMEIICYEDVWKL